MATYKRVGLEAANALATQIKAKQDKLTAGTNITISGNKISATKTPVIDALDSTSTTSALSANQGRVLNALIGDIGSALDMINGEVI